MYKFQGKIKVINDTQVISEKFKKREFVVTDTSSMYPQDVMFQSVQDKCDMLNGYAVEEQLKFLSTLEVVNGQAQTVS